MVFGIESAKAGSVFFQTDEKLNRTKLLRLELNEIPPSVNNIWRTSNIRGFQRTYMTKEGKEFKERLSKTIPDSFQPFCVPLQFKLILTFPNRRRRDIDNFSKAILDALAPKVYTDDSLIQEMHIWKRYEKGISRIEIEIEPI